MDLRSQNLERNPLNVQDQVTVQNSDPQPFLAGGTLSIKKKLAAHLSVNLDQYYKISFKIYMSYMVF